jgi:hypothetical protein
MKSAYKFRVGQLVRVTARGYGRPTHERYEVMALLPEERGDRQYRVKSVGDSHQRVVWESEIGPGGA